MKLHFSLIFSLLFNIEADFLNIAYYADTHLERYEPLDPRNEKLDTVLSNFYSEYADSIGAEKDAKYDEKLSDAKSNAYKIIVEYCDIYKINAMNKLKPYARYTSDYT